MSFRNFFSFFKNSFCSPTKTQSIFGLVCGLGNGAGEKRYSLSIYLLGAKLGQLDWQTDKNSTADGIWGHFTKAAAHKWSSFLNSALIDFVLHLTFASNWACLGQLFQIGEKVQRSGHVLVHFLCLKHVCEKWAIDRLLSALIRGAGLANRLNHDNLYTAHFMLYKPCKPKPVVYDFCLIELAGLDSAWGISKGFTRKSGKELDGKVVRGGCREPMAEYIASLSVDSTREEMHSRATCELDLDDHFFAKKNHIFGLEDYSSDFTQKITIFCPFLR